MIVQDDRTGRELFTHKDIIKGRDNCLSGWGSAKHGSSYAGWACKSEHVRQVRNWVESRSDIKRVTLVESNYIPAGKGHYHIYVVNEGHPALK